MQEYSKVLKAFLKANGLTQIELALKAGVHQSTVSRVPKKEPQRFGAARQKLFSYIEANSNKADFSEGDAHLKVMAAFNKVWDNTDDHAEAIARVIQSLSGLEPKRRQSKDKRL